MAQVNSPSEVLESPRIEGGLPVTAFDLMAQIAANMNEVGFELKGVCQLKVETPADSSYLAPSAGGAVACRGEHPSPVVSLSMDARLLEDFAAGRVDVHSAATYAGRLSVTGAFDRFLDVHAFVRSCVGARMILDEAAWRSEQHPTPSIRRVAGASSETIRRAWERSEPVVLVGAFLEAEPWTLERVREEFGGLRVLKYRSCADTILIRDYVDGILRGDLVSSGGFALPREMEARFGAPSSFAAADLDRPLAFLGAAGALTSAHRHVPNSVAQQIFGEKQWTLFPPHQAPLLYPWTRITLSQQSDVDIDAPDLTKHPRFAEATPLRVKLTAGETLLVPSGWFHHVRALTPAMSTFRAERGLIEEASRRTRARRRPTPREGGFESMVSRFGRALDHRNYRLFFTGQSISLVGTWLTKIATSWLVYRLTGSAWLLGVAGFAGQIPMLLLAPLAGVLVDRWNRRRVLLGTQALAMLQSALLATLALGGFIRVWEIIALNVFQGVVDAFEMPARESLVVQMVDERAELPNAIALNSAIVNAARLVGPAVAGGIIAAFGEGWCFFIDAISYGAVILSVLAIRVDTPLCVPAARRVFHEMAEGFRYASGFAPIRAPLLLLAFTGLAGRPFAVLLPVIAREVMQGGAGTLGALQATAGVGALAGTLYLASRTSVLGLDRVIVSSTALFGLGLVAFSRVHLLWLAMPLLLLAGTGMVLQTAASNTIIQTIVDEDKRGRVMSLLAMSLFGTMPFGSLIVGAFATRIGAENTILLSGAACVLAAGLFHRALPELRRAVRPVYERMGILPKASAAAEVPYGSKTPSRRSSRGKSGRGEARR